MANGPHEPASTDHPEVARLLVALRLTEMAGAHNDPVQAANHIGFFTAAIHAAQSNWTNPESAKAKIQAAAKAFGIPESQD